VGKGSSSPPPPDYTGAAQAQAASSREIATQTTQANRPNQYTPWGSSTWNSYADIDPGTGQQVTRWQQQEQLNPQLQGALNDQFALQAGKSQLAGSFMGRVADEYSRPFDWTNLPSMAGTPQAQMTGQYGVQGAIPQYGQQMNVPQYGQQQNVAQYGMDLSAPQQTTATTNEPGFTGERQRIEQGLFDRMRPEQQFQEDRTRTMLANQGLTPGSEAYNRELGRLGEQQAGERYNAMNMAGQEQQRMQQMMLGQQQQAFGQDLSSQQAQNAALQAQFGQGLQAGQFTNQALQNQFSQGLQSGQFTNQALQNQFGQGLQAGQFYNQAGQQQFNQEMGANAQNFGQMQQMADYQNKMRQQAIAEQAMQRGMSLNEMNALLTGQQVGTPQMPSFQSATAAQPLQALAAAQGQGQYAADMAKADAQQGSGLWSGLGSLAGAAATVF
jgi:hypothetical protein